jgi:hypothetical protein
MNENGTLPAVVKAETDKIKKCKVMVRIAYYDKNDKLIMESDARELLWCNIGDSVNIKVRKPVVTVGLVEA